MLLTITYTKKPSTDLGYLLHKNPFRPQTFDTSFGKVHVFFNEITEEKCAASILLDLDPVLLTRGKRGNNEGGLFEYVNDRPYVSSSFLSVALSNIFSSAMSGKCKEKPELVDVPLPFVVKIVMLPCRGSKENINKIFEPLGYEVSIEDYLLDDKYTGWGKSRYYTVTLEGNIRMKDLLNHLYVLIPVLDLDKHYWINETEIDKLLTHGEGWLSNHPEKELITSRYLKKRKGLINRALEKLLEDDLDEIEENNNGSEEEELGNKYYLNEQRLNEVVKEIKSLNVSKVLDIGCGEGKLISLLLKDNNITKITGVDISYDTQEKAKSRLKYDRLPDKLRNKINLFQGSLTYRDSRFIDYDVITIIEVIEHLDLNRLNAFEKVIFKYAHPNNIIITTPNKDYNKCYENLGEDKLRHKDHRFEWTREEFKKWCETIKREYGYAYKILEIGEKNPEFGSPTQMGVFTL